MPQDKPDLILFGCDGVLVDSESLLARIREKVLAAAGIELSAEALSMRFAGHSFQEMLLTLERESDRPLQASMIDEAERLVDERLRRVQATDGARQAVAALPRRAIASNAPRRRLQLMLQASGLSPLFGQSIFSFEDVENGRPKPAPDVLLHAAASLNADPARCFVIEDTAHGIQAAISAGMRPIGYTGASHSFTGHADLLTEAGAETVIHRWNMLMPILAALGEWRDA